MIRYTKIMVFGTFDVLHKGHLSFFRQARKLAKNPYLIVSVARDVNVKKIKKIKPLNRELTRLGLVKRCPLVDKAVLGGTKSHLPHIVKEKPQIIALGYDQKHYTNRLKNRLASRGLKVEIIRLKSYRPSRYKTSFFKQKVVEYQYK